ncbi:hypothetical protein H072_8290 [Dactylellina haptotyla CBS 200.50]|uniref:Uncharacterized protein n=1 Tax=Dactylellina haptotyla (strain CBS 200.50) TaxID=1284197 RepID=S8A4Q3_DACHA|nr:hypothetical protein H072_8290 [Dactylellina haptotyla CBS 200.50]
MFPSLLNEYTSENGEKSDDKGGERKSSSKKSKKSECRPSSVVALLLGSEPDQYRRMMESDLTQLRKKIRKAKNWGATKGEIMRMIDYIQQISTVYFRAVDGMIHANEAAELYSVSAKALVDLRPLRESLEQMSYETRFVWPGEEAPSQPKPELEPKQTAPRVSNIFSPREKKQEPAPTPNKEDSGKGNKIIPSFLRTGSVTAAKSTPKPVRHEYEDFGSQEADYSTQSPHAHQRDRESSYTNDPNICKSGCVSAACGKAGSPSYYSGQTVASSNSKGQKPEGYGRHATPSEYRSETSNYSRYRKTGSYYGSDGTEYYRPQTRESDYRGDERKGEDARSLNTAGQTSYDVLPDDKGKGRNRKNKEPRTSSQYPTITPNKASDCRPVTSDGQNIRNEPTLNWSKESAGKHLDALISELEGDSQGPKRSTSKNKPPASRRYGWVPQNTSWTEV